MDSDPAAVAPLKTRIPACAQHFFLRNRALARCPRLV
ncbi:hypothetical protein JMJ77_0000993 [Colletotrichum scovillei]|uniref:Uncharacterized protein n=1 Tax=Colletotrichum scovillei TaxID=1209932 RepID=A0A9P7RAQ8_9PEZI|nr:hypothetical protein JMJ77_0000993 [Colletotrichum scovillei]KAG7072212.1 hypothetical protein JMJ76_0005069 [Colletotrichum scovillei]KAG7080555.1 hypothetical protein JMJ78_0007647 [Colletotrichum scovillei]